MPTLSPSPPAARFCEESRSSSTEERFRVSGLDDEAGREREDGRKVKRHVVVQVVARLFVKSSLFCKIEKCKVPKKWVRALIVS